MSVEEFTYLRGRTTRPVKVTLVSAQQAAAYYDPDKSRAAYPTRDAYLADLVDFTRREIAELRAPRLRVRPDRRAAVRGAARRDDSRGLPAARQRSGSAARRVHRARQRHHRRPPGVTFGIHICRGNYQSMFYASGGYDRIAQQVFRRSRFHRFLLEYDDARSGTFEPLRHVPDDRVVVLGLVSTKKPRLESMDELRARIAEAARVVPLERLAVSPQCGFASTAEGNRLVARRPAAEARDRRRHGTGRLADVTQREGVTMREGEPT